MVTDKTALDHDARILFDQLMQDLVARHVCHPTEVIAVMRRIAKDGNGWAA